MVQRGIPQGTDCAYPFYYLLICTISDNQMVNLGRITLFPKGIHFDNYIKIFQIQNLINSFTISILRTVIGTASSLLITSYMAYFFTKENMWGKKAGTGKFLLGLHHSRTGQRLQHDPGQDLD